MTAERGRNEEGRGQKWDAFPTNKFPLNDFHQIFLPDPGVSGVRSMAMGPGLSMSGSFGRDFADVTLADDDSNSMLADDANRAIWG